MLAALASATAPASTIMTIRQTKAKGEYVNTTYFVTQDDFEKYLMFEKNNDNIERFAMQTDGIETISLINYKEPSLAFFNPFFDCLKDEPADLEISSEQLKNWINANTVWTEN